MPCVVVSQWLRPQTLPPQRWPCAVSYHSQTLHSNHTELRGGMEELSCYSGWPLYRLLSPEISWNQDSYSSCRRLLITILTTILLPFLYILHGRFSRRRKKLIIETPLCRRRFAIQMCSPSPPSIFYPLATTGEHSVFCLQKEFSHTPLPLPHLW